MDPLDPGSYAADSWPQAAVFIVFLLVVVALPSLLSWLGNRRVKSVEKQFENNGGSTLKDAVDRIEALLLAHIEEAESRDTERDSQISALDQRLAKTEQDARHAAEPRGLLRRLIG